MAGITTQGNGGNAFENCTVTHESEVCGIVVRGNFDGVVYENCTVHSSDMDDEKCPEQGRFVQDSRSETCK